jgi:hypothetical protein
VLIEVNGAEVKADPLGAIYWPSEQTLVVSDLHIEKGSYFASKGQLVPPYDSRSTLKRLKALQDLYEPQIVIALGDSFHDSKAAERISDDDAQSVMDLTKRCDWVWIIGNHDPEPPRNLGGRIALEIAIGPLSFRHQPIEGPCAGEVAGHLHPCASVSVRGRRLRRRCFVSDGDRMVLPSFGAYTGGLDVFDPAYQEIFPNRFHAWMIGRKEIYPVSSERLARRAA